jgi:hypothetical protein
MVREEVIYRRGVSSDAADLAGFGSQSFVDAYGDTNPRREVALHVASTYSAELQLAELVESGSWTIVGDREGEIVAAAGFYRKWGFREAGQVPFRLGTIVQRDLLMTRTLPAD